MKLGTEELTKRFLDEIKLRAYDDKYIDRQEEHHRTRTFQEEYRDLLRRYHVEFDERYVWD